MSTWTPPPAGSAAAAHFRGADSLARARRRDALRAAADPDRPAPTPPRTRQPGTGGDWPRPPRALVAARLHQPPERARVTVAGLVIVRQRPGSAKGVIFVTLEDETGVVNVVIWTKVFERFRRAVIAGRLLRVTGRLQRDGEVVHVIAETIEDLSHLLDALAARAMPDPAGPADEVRRPVPAGARGPSSETPTRPGGAGARHPRDQARKLFPSRDFR